MGESLEHYLQRIAQQQPIVAEQAQRLASQINSVLYQEVVVSAESEQEMLEPLRAGLIYGKVGITIRTGLVGSLRWPKHGKAVAKFLGEAEKLTESKIDWDKITVAPKRLGVAIPVTRQELFNSEGVVESVIKAEMPQAIIDKINDALFTTDKAVITGCE